MTTEAVQEAFDTELQKLQNRKVLAGGEQKTPPELSLAITPIELVALGWHFFQPTANGSIFDGDRVTPRSVDWGKCQAQAIQAVAVGTVTLQNKVLQLIVAQNKAAKHATE